jgi:hypothetical protein
MQSALAHRAVGTIMAGGKRNKREFKKCPNVTCSSIHIRTS